MAKKLNKKFKVTWNLGFVEYEVRAKNESEAIAKALKKRLDDGFLSPNSELVSVEVDKP